VPQEPGSSGSHTERKHVVTFRLRSVRRDEFTLTAGGHAVVLRPMRRTCVSRLQPVRALVMHLLDRARLFSTVLPLTVMACGGGGSEPPPAAVFSVSVSASQSSLVPGERSMVSWQVHNADGSLAADQAVTLSSSDPARLTVSSSGELAAVSAGTATITARKENVTATALVTIDEGGIVDATGGVIVALGDRVRLEVPASAVAQSTAIRVRSSKNPLLDPTEVVGSVFTVSPEDLSFANPVTAHVTFDATRGPVGLPAASERLRIFVGGSWSALSGSTTDAVANVATATLTRGGILSVGWLPPPTPCTSPESRQFDFWVGSWTVLENGQGAGSSDITLAPGGCAIFEHFRSAGVGRSISFYEPTTAKWYQTYVDSDDHRLLLGGRFQSGGVDLLNPPDGGTVHARTRWTAEGTNVRQQVDALTTNGGASYALPLFNFVYQPR